MFDLENIKVKELFSSDNFSKYVQLKDMIESKDYVGQFKAKKLGSLTFGQVSRLKRLIVNPDIDAIYQMFEMVFGMEKVNVDNTRAVAFLYALNHITKEMKSLVDREVKMLGSDEDPLWEYAGGNRLDRFKEMNTLVKIGREYSKSPLEIQEWSYSLVFTIVLQDKIMNEVQAEYNELKSKQS